MSCFDAAHDTVVIWERKDSAISAMLLPQLASARPRRLWTLPRARREREDLLALGERVIISPGFPGWRQRSVFEMTALDLRRGLVSGVIKLPFPLEDYGYDASHLYGLTNSGLVFRASLDRLIKKSRN
jgi:hypothetical protein